MRVIIIIPDRTYSSTLSCICTDFPGSRGVPCIYLSTYPGHTWVGKRIKIETRRVNPYPRVTQTRNCAPLYQQMKNGQWFLDSWIPGARVVLQGRLTQIRCRRIKSGI
jgi:hypothetical protein